MATVGVLALQGDFEAHGRMLAACGARPIEVRTAQQLADTEGLVIPGGESTTMLRLLRDENLLEPLRRYGRERPIFGTCAGAILLAARVAGPEQESLALVDIEIERNAYGRQLESRVVRLRPEPAFQEAVRNDAGGPPELEAVFIRAPIIRAVGPGVKVLIRYQGDPVLVAQDRHLAATFHPELTSDLRVHRLFLDRIGR